MPCKTKSRQTSRESVRTVHAMPLDTPRPPIFNLKLSKNGFCEKVDFQFFCSFCCFLAPIGPVLAPIGAVSATFPPKGTAQVPGTICGICAVWGCLGGWHGPYDAIPSNFGGVWSYMAWGKSIFMFFWKYWKLTSSPNTSKWVLGPPGWSSYCFESQGTTSGK